MANILTIIPYSFYPPRNGGSLRCYYILREMSRGNTIYVITSHAENFKEINETPLSENIKIINFEEHPSYKSIFNLLPGKLSAALNYRLIRRSLKGPANNILLKIHPLIRNLTKTIDFDIINFENLESVGMTASLFNRICPHAVKIYDAHNVDSELWREQGKHSFAKTALHIEESLSDLVDTFFCCSEEDNRKLTELNKNKIAGVTIPNGVDTTLKAFDNNPGKSSLNEILFCGSLDYFPNKEGLNWFYSQVFPLVRKSHPSLILTVVGKIQNTAGYEDLINDPSVNFIGGVDSVNEYYKKSALAIVPLKHGSGTRLKILEAMSMGCPVVSTSIGASGLVYECGKHLMIGDNSEDFASKIELLLGNDSLYEQVRKNALTLVREKYDWNVIGTKIRSSLQHLISEKRIK